MKAKHWMAALAVASVAGLAGATEIYGWQTDVDKFKDFKSTKTRAEVIAELEKARASGELDHYRNNYEYQMPRTKPAAAGKTRAEVVNELKQAQASGEFDAVRNNYEYQQRPFQDAKSSKTREEVRAEMNAAPKKQI
ncbi:MAG: DUF4148 domain-containing protein, partial [Candidatus Protistobacter heckmanni]|nr:DUF4148 domain-containing protein [Candidatus Protistobacter heckmanni]